MAKEKPKSLRGTTRPYIIPLLLPDCPPLFLSLLLTHGQPYQPSENKRTSGPLHILLCLQYSPLARPHGLFSHFLAVCPTVSLFGRSSLISPFKTAIPLQLPTPFALRNGPAWMIEFRLTPSRFLVFIAPLPGRCTFHVDRDVRLPCSSLYPRLWNRAHTQ